MKHEALPSFTLRELEIFHVLIQAGKTTVAALLLSVSQPAISRSIAQLEKTLDQRLFERVGGRLVPTREALAIANELEPIFSALNRLGDQSAVISAAHSGPLRIAAPPTIAHRFLPERIARFMKYNPDLEVIFDVRPLRDRKAHFSKNGDHFVEGLTDRMQPAFPTMGYRQGDINRLFR